MKKATTMIKQNSLILISNLIADALICNEFEQLDRQTKSDLALYQTLQANFFDGDDDIQLEDFSINVSNLQNNYFQLINLLEWVKGGVIQPTAKSFFIATNIELHQGVYETCLYMTIDGYIQLQLLEYKLRELIYPELKRA